MVTFFYKYIVKNGFCLTVCILREFAPSTMGSRVEAARAITQPWNDGKCVENISANSTIIIGIILSILYLYCT